MTFILGILFGFAATSAASYFIWSFVRRHYESIKSSNVMEDLELATNDQLLEQYRNRPNNSYIILLPISDEDEQGIRIECNNFAPADSVSILHLATNLLMRELKQRGIEVPELPDLEP